LSGLLLFLLLLNCQGSVSSLPSFSWATVHYYMYSFPPVKPFFYFVTFFLTSFMTSNFLIFPVSPGTVLSGIMTRSQTLRTSGSDPVFTKFRCPQGQLTPAPSLFILIVSSIPGIKDLTGIYLFRCYISI
jgi:hypothetical protein